MFESLDRKLEASKRRAAAERAAQPMTPEEFRLGNRPLPDGTKKPSSSVVSRTGAPAAGAVPAVPAAPPSPAEALAKDASNGNGKNRIADAMQLPQPGSFWQVDHLPNRVFETMDGLAPLENLSNVSAIHVVRYLTTVSPDLRVQVGYRKVS